MTTRHLGFWAALGTVGFVGSYVAFVRTGPGQDVDQSAMEAIARLAVRTGTADVAEQALGWVTPALLLLAGLTVVAVAAWRGPRVALAALITGVSIPVLSQVLKPALHRPDLIDGAWSNSYPSGHVAAVAGLAAAAIVALAPRARPWAAWILALPALTVGAATVALSWHRPSDVIGSLALALACGATGALLADRPRHPRQAPQRERQFSSLK